ncbi:lipase maturation factor 2 isoform X1 [Astyanax mexicanus]|uniref:Lipase maturation factor n=2 Tax=Astyanax mexicanus TaxID=7994 RepID=A0A8T2LNE5_ASTMX|nr:lipase maturation factor 2 isoform X1 [Astyanax mexicanus]
MGETRLARHMFLWCLSAVYMFAFASVYVQIPGLYGNEGLLPARWMLRVSGKSVWEQLTDSPTLLWFGPRLGLDTQQCMELLSLSGALLSLAATAIPTLRDCRVYLVLWMLYLSLYQVGQVFLYFQWDNLLLEVGFLAILVAPMNMPWGWRLHAHDNMTFWLVRWLLFRLMFASGVVKLTSRCPTWWGLTAVTYHYETQCIPTPLAWFAHQLPVWFQKLSVVGTYVIEIGGPFLFFSPIRRHRLTAFYMQVLLQVLIILSGNYNFFNLLTIVLCFSLLDDEHVNFWLCRRTPREERTSLQTLLSRFCLLVELAVYALLAYWTFLYFDLKVDWDKKSVSSKTAFTHFEFNRFLKLVTVPSIWIGVLSLTWEIVTAKFKSACLKGVFWRLWSTVHWAVFAVATASMFAISLVPYTFIEYEANSNIWPGVRKAYEQSDRYQLVNSYGLFRRMTGVGGRPEVVIEGSMDGSTWIEIEFMYKPGNVSRAPPVVTPHQPRLDWQMWFAALGPQTQSPWFSSLVHRLLQGKRDVIKLIQTDESQYPFSQQPPVYVRAHRYKYWFTAPKEDGSFPQRWWRRVYVEEFYPAVHLGNAFLEHMLAQHGLKDKPPVRQASETWLPRTLKFVGDHVRDVPAPLLLWTLFSSAATVCLVNTLCSRTRPPQHSHCRPAQPTSEQMAKKEKEERKVEKKNKNMNIKEEEDEEEDAEGEDEKDKTKEMVEEKGKDDDATNEEDVDVSEENEEDDNDEDEEQTSEEKDHVRKRK